METKFNGNASVKARFIFFITHSQSYIIICAFLGMLCLLFGFYLTYKGFPFDRVCQPYFFAFVFIFISFFMANKTHKNIDLSDAKETEISITSSGDFKIITDVRASESLKNVSEILQVAANMHMLPKADGLLDDKLNVIPNSASSAEDLVNDLNKNARSACDDILAKLNRKKIFKMIYVRVMMGLCNHQITLSNSKVVFLWFLLQSVFIVSKVDGL